ncbi:HD-GYP domain-containing protein [Aquibacillus salsiterrae]|uniref:HD domain-containing protein n=1 Tax=Aquibacillus salsiterrae TaxID=2950439 RepID=A0A9X3WJD1_9BACI|nr:HD domain-containing phosphohydrolase [Aquibacillus salsiterrae]MDC3418429.1 HD domain-containing protein [Aquibacillus salsiterrae]
MKSSDFLLRAERLFNQISQDHEVLRIFKYHSLRVMYFSIYLGQQVGCDDDDLQIASLLHDIGKIGLAKEILLKPSKLDELEYQIIQAHSTIGNNILRKTLNMPRAAVFVRDHHERWDGKGYPRGLEKENISTQGRIIGICDAFDTMTIDRRNYNRRTLTYQEAIRELKRCSWTQFDGKLVDLFESLIHDLDLPTPEHWAENMETIEKIFAAKIID